MLTFALALLAALLAGALPARAESPPMGRRSAAPNAVLSLGVLPFDPLSFEPPQQTWRETWNDVSRTRWWAVTVVQAAVRMGLLDGEYSTRMVEITEALLHRPELNWDVPLRGNTAKHLRFQLKAVDRHPQAAVILVW